MRQGQRTSRQTVPFPVTHNAGRKWRLQRGRGRHGEMRTNKKHTPTRHSALKEGDPRPRSCASRDPPSANNHSPACRCA